MTCARCGKQITFVQKPFPHWVDAAELTWECPADAGDDESLYHEPEMER